MSGPQRVNRRNLLLGFGAGSVMTAVLAACGSPTASPTAAPAPKPTEAPKPAAAATTAPAAATTAPVAGTTAPAAATTAPAAGATTAPATKPTEAAAKPAAAITSGTVTLWHGWGNNMNEGGAGPNIELCALFEKNNPGVKCENVYDATWDKILTALAGGAPPDLFILSADQLPALADRGAVRKLDDFIQRDKVDMNRFYDFVRKHTSFGGSYYAMTHHPDVRLTWHDALAYKEGGLAVDPVLKSWDDLIARGRAMTKKEGNRLTRLGFVPNWTSDPWVLDYVQFNGAKLLSPDGKQATFATEEGIAAVEWVSKYIDDLFGGTRDVMAVQQSQQKFVSDPVYGGFPQHLMGIAFYGNWLVDAIEIDSPQGNMDFVTGTFPGGPAQSGKEFIVGGGTMTAIPTNAKNVDLAWQWLLMLISDEGGYLVQRLGNDVSGIVTAANDPRIIAAKKNRDKVLPLFQKATAQAYVDSPVSDQFQDLFTRAGDAILLKQGTPRDVLTQAAKDAQKALDDYYAKKR
jgi:ABC-type glycerol-3-phosphate transport system substrate-binding protein